MDGNVTVVSSPTVALRLTSTLSSFEVNRKFSRGLSVAELKGKLELIVGTPATSMDLELFSVADAFLQKLDDNNALLGSYHVDDDCRVHVTDRSGARTGEFTDVSRVEKYEISDEAYARRKESARSFLKKAKAGRLFGEGDVAKKQTEAAAALEEAKEKAAAGGIAVGDRCRVQIPGQPDKTGTVMYVGATDFKPGYWVGVRYDEPLGKHDGSVDGKRYFECQDGYGAFVKPLNVTVGAYAQEDYDLDEM